MNVLGIETSCDETAAAVVCDGRIVLSNIVSSQVAHHRPYGGVVPEIASRHHVEALPGMIEEALSAAGVAWADLDRLAVTYGPGLASSLMVGVSAAKALSLRLNLPLMGVNHLEAHVYSVFLGPDAPSPEEACPMLVLLVSGGHTCLVHMRGIGSYELLGQTLDDAAGEALDKGATLFDLGYPGGPAIEKAAVDGDTSFVRFPRGLEKKGKHGAYDFSFSGLKTALMYYVRDNPDAVLDTHRASVAASFQEAVFDTLTAKVEAALQAHPDIKSLACVGGVAKNKVLRSRIDRLAAEARVALHLARMEFCTDNAAMIAALAAHDRGVLVGDELDLDVVPGLSVVPAR